MISHILFHPVSHILFHPFRGNIINSFSTKSTLQMFEFFALEKDKMTTTSIAFKSSGGAYVQLTHSTFHEFYNISLYFHHRFLMCLWRCRQLTKASANLHLERRCFSFTYQKISGWSVIYFFKSSIVSASSLLTLYSTRTIPLFRFTFQNFSPSVMRYSPYSYFIIIFPLHFNGRSDKMETQGRAVSRPFPVPALYFDGLGCGSALSGFGLISVMETVTRATVSHCFTASAKLRKAFLF